MKQVVNICQYCDRGCWKPQVSYIFCFHFPAKRNTVTGYTIVTILHHKVGSRLQWAVLGMI